MSIFKQSPYRSALLVGVIVGFAWCGCTAPTPPVVDPDWRLVLNEDNDHYFKLDSSLMTEEALRGYVEQLAGTKVTHFFMCPNGQRVSYDSRVDEPIWAGENDEPLRHSWCINARILHQRGIDPYRVWIDQCRKQRISPWITMRMNDAHGLSSKRSNYRNTRFWREHPELRRVPQTACDNLWETAQLMSFDYSKPAAYAHQMALVKELFERYDVDGFEVDWMRNPYLLSPGCEREQAGVLSRFMREVRSEADRWERRRGHPIEISARVPTEPDVAADWGFQVQTWVKEGLIDMLVPTSFYNSMNTNIPVAAWREILADAPKRVRLIPGTDYHFAAYRTSQELQIPLEVYDGWAAGLLEQGVDGLYFFNLPYTNPFGKNAPLRPMLDRGFTTEGLQRVRRRHPVTYPDWPSPGASYRDQLPRTTDSMRQFTLQTGRKVLNGYLSVLIGLGATEDSGMAELPVTLNGVQPLRWFTYTANGEYFSNRVSRMVQYVFPLKSLQNGENLVTVYPGASVQCIEWVEIVLTPQEAQPNYEI